MKANSENVFVGCKLTKNGETYTVIKKNEKSFYAWQNSYEEFLDRWEKRLGATFKLFCKNNEIEMFKYDGFEISEEEAARKEVAEQNKDSGYKLESYEKKGIKAELEYLDRKKRNPILYQFDCRKKTIRFLDKKDNSFLMNIDGDYVLYSLNTGEVVKIGTVFDRYESIPWERLSEFRTA